MENRPTDSFQEIKKLYYHLIKLTLNILKSIRKRDIQRAEKKTQEREMLIKLLSHKKKSFKGQVCFDQLQNEFDLFSKLTIEKIQELDLQIENEAISALREMAKERAILNQNRLKIKKFSPNPHK